MGLTAWIRRVVGTDDLLTALKQDREQLFSLMQEVVRISGSQTDAAARLTQSLETILSGWQVEGEPVTRHMSDEIEADIFEQESKRGS
jgi:hypothetical protein